MKRNKNSKVGWLVAFLIFCALAGTGGGTAGVFRTIFGMGVTAIVLVTALVALLLVFSQKNKGQNKSQNQNQNQNSMQNNRQQNGQYGSIGSAANPNTAGGTYHTTGNRTTNYGTRNMSSYGQRGTNYGGQPGGVYNGVPYNGPVSRSNGQPDYGQGNHQNVYTAPPMPDFSHLKAEDAEALRKGHENLNRLRSIMLQIQDMGVKSRTNEICNVMEKILQTLRVKDDQIDDVRQFLSYYIPTLCEILKKYETIERSGVSASGMTDKVNTYLVQIKQAMDKQYENLFEDDKLDLTVEMEAMTMACKQDGLLEGEKTSKMQSEEQGITLTL